MCNAQTETTNLNKETQNNEISQERTQYVDTLHCILLRFWFTHSSHHNCTFEQSRIPYLSKFTRFPLSSNFDSGLTSKTKI